MFEFSDSIPRKLQLCLTGALIFVTALLLLVLAAVAMNRYVHLSSASDQSSSSSLMGVSDSSNAVTRSFIDIANAAGQGSGAVARGVAGSANGVAKAGESVVHGTAVGLSATGRALGSGTLFTLRLVGTCLMLPVRLAVATVVFPFKIIGASVMFVGRMPMAILGYFTKTQVVSALIMPADSMAPPRIDGSPAVLAAPATPLASAIPVAVAMPPALTPAPQWPIHGVITTLFGVPEPPYMPIHTGLDISDGKPAGVTPIHPFEPGTVIQVIHERIKLGNEVIIDHGGGITSIYGHLHSTMVVPGQKVNENTVLGFEGSTGVSTGPHLHFEIRVNGTPEDPHKFIPGQP